MKVILLDWSYFVHCAIKGKNAMLKLQHIVFELYRQGKSIKEIVKLAKTDIYTINNILNNKFLILPATYTACTMILGNLKRVGVQIDDKIILVQDRHSWRKKFEGEYKGNRNELRDKDVFVNWKEEFGYMNKLSDRLNQSTPFHIVAVEEMEADDIIAVATDVYKDKQCIIVSCDHDFDQLLYRDNVKLFSPHTHPSVKKCPYRILDLDRTTEKENALASIEKKIKKEAVDNLIKPILNEEDYKLRRMLIDLLNLPDFVTEPIKQALSQLPEKKEYDLNLFPFKKMKDKFNDIYNSPNTITYEQCRKKYLKKLTK